MNWARGGYRWMLNGDLADFFDFCDPKPSHAGNGVRIRDALGWCDSVLPSQAGEFDAMRDDILLKTSDTGVVGHQYMWRSDFAAHKRTDWGVTVRLVSARTKGAETRTSNAQNLNYLYWVAFGNTFIARRGDEYRDLFPVWGCSRVPGCTIPASVMPLSAGAPYPQSTTSVDGVDNGRYGARGAGHGQERHQGAQGLLLLRRRVRRARRGHRLHRRRPGGHQPQTRPA